MKKYCLIMILVFLTSAVFAQKTIQKSNVQLNAGFGLSSWGVPLYVGLDFKVPNDLTFGGEISFRSYNDNWQSNRYNHTLIGISGNGNYHFNRILNIPAPWDLYAGLNLGFYIWNSPDAYNGSHSSGLGLGAQVGGRYYFTQRFGINFELGGGNGFSEGKLGITLKL